MKKLGIIIGLFLLTNLGCKTTLQPSVEEPVITETSPQPMRGQEPDGPFPVVMIKDLGDTVSHPLKMTELKISVNVIGSLATTTMEMVFYNAEDRVLEGQLYFPLGEGQTISRFAMDVNGTLREGVIVEKTKGRQAFESIVRKSIDPGLIEWTQGNNFKSRIYPIPEKGTKRIVVAYEQELVRDEQGWLFLLPLNFQEAVNRFSLEVQVFKQKIAPIPEENELANFTFSEWEESFVGKQDHKDYLPNQQLGFRLPMTKSGVQTLVEKSPDGETYFHLSSLPTQFLKEKQQPKKIALLWDASHSMHQRDIEKETKLLDAYFRQLGSVTVELIVVRNEVEVIKKYSVENGEWETLLTKLQDLPNDGGTQLGKLDLTQFNCDEFLLFSDGLSNFGESEIKLSNVPVQVIVSNSSVDFSYLRYLAQASGGQLIDLNVLTETAAIRALGYQPYQFISASYDESEITETWPSIPTQVTGQFSISGKLKSNKGNVSLAFGVGNEVLHREEVSLSSNAATTQTGLVKRMWAQKKLRELDLRHEENSAIITELGKTHGMITRNTSLIVLDRVEDYVEHRILPPLGMRREYARLLKADEENQKIELLSHLDQVALDFMERKRWWEKKFEIPLKSYQQDSIRIDNRSNDDDWGSDEDMDGVVDFNEESSSQSDVLDLFDFRDEPAAEAKADVAPEPVIGEGKITLNPWNPETPYLATLKKTAKNDLYEVYLDLKKEHAATPAFFVDVANYFFEKKMPELGLRILSNIAELELENHELLRVLGHRLEQLGYYKLAIDVYSKIQEIREEEPQSHRDLALALAKHGRTKEAVDLLYEVVKTKWDTRFPGINVLVAHEMNAVLAKSKSPVSTSDIDPQFLAELPTDIRVVLNWDADAVDMDLWVIDPRGEKCYYQNRETAIGGYMSNDFTGGYGPEEFLIKKAMPGIYKVQINYYGSRQQRIAGPTTVQVQLITGYATAAPEVQEITLRLASESEVITVGELEFK